ncbi:MAG: hypothetical protein ABIQ18_39725 [Umezawaea sp.]
MSTISTLEQPRVELVTDIRNGLDHGTPHAYRGAALPQMLQALSRNTFAAHVFADPRSTPDLLNAVTLGDKDAEAPLYVRCAAELDRMAATAVGSSALDREDLHQEGALRLITDARSGKITNDFAGNLGPYLGRAVLGHMRNIASTQSPGKPNDPGRLTQKLRQALRATSDADGNYDLIGAATYARTHFAWTLETFWDVHAVMFAVADDLYSRNGGGYTLGETLGDTDATDALNRIENIETARALMASPVLAPREREVLGVLMGFDGPALSEGEAGKILGVSQQAIWRIKRVALGKLAAIADN